MKNPTSSFIIYHNNVITLDTDKERLQHLMEQNARVSVYSPEQNLLIIGQGVLELLDGPLGNYGNTTLMVFYYYKDNLMCSAVLSRNLELLFNSTHHNVIGVFSIESYQTLNLGFDTNAIKFGSDFNTIQEQLRISLSEHHSRIFQLREHAREKLLGFN